MVWSRTATITPSDPEASEQFGFSVAYDGDYAMVGAPLDDFELSGGGTVLNSGSAYLFAYDGAAWTEEAKLTRAGGGAASDYFGYSVSMHAGRAVAGAYQVDSGAGSDTGAAYSFVLDGSSWVEEAMLSPSDPMPGSFFGYSVASGDTTLVGAWGQVPPGGLGARYGAAYLFELGPVGDVDTDGDGLTDGDENTIYGTDPLLADTDGDGLSDGDEVLTFLTDPLLADTDGDTLGDGYEISLQAFGNCPSPLLADSDDDGLTDDIELAFIPALDPCDADYDNDGLSDGNEALAGTDPTVPDTDGDGLLDGTEVDMAQSGPCPDPLVADSDGDGLADGAEVDAGTDLCNPDTDGDGANDAIDPTPTVPGVSSGLIEDWLRELSDEAQDFNLSLFDAPNNNAARGRRLLVIIQLDLAAKATSRGRFLFAILDLELLRARIDGDSHPKDWMNPSPEQAQLLQDIDLAISWLEYELE
ncbi:MAG: FG-GAP repeat protein [Phycisphaerales bacterium]|nr:FG-GAP repeat protein [Phycisphaerales bacterium]